MSGIGAAPAIQVAVRSANRLLREAIATSLAAQRDLVVTGATEGLPDLQRLCSLRRTDVTLIDVSKQLADEELDAVLAIRAMSPDLGIVLTYPALSTERITAATRAGATSLVPYSRGIDALIRAIRESARPPARHPARSVVLTDRDMEVLVLMSAGYSVREMARLLGVTASTVDNHKRRIFAKLGAHSQTGVVAGAARMGLLWAAALRDLSRAPQPLPVKAVVVLGSSGPIRDTVMRTLLRHAIPVLVIGREIPAEDDELLRLQGQVAVVLVDGHDNTWRTVRAIGARTVVATGDDPGAIAIAEDLIRGADAVLSAGDVPAQLAHVVALASQGYATTDAAREMMRSMAARSPSVRSALTPRELDILRSIAAGHSVRQTASALGITTKTVENIQARLFAKLAVHNRAQALAVAYGLGLVIAE